MANNAIKWEAAPTDRGSILTTQLNSLGDGAWSTAGAEVDNTTNLDTWGVLELLVTFGSAPGATGFVNVYLHQAPDGTNYPTLDTDNDPRSDMWLCSIAVIDTTSAQRRITKPFRLPFTKFKISLENQSGQAFPASGSTVELYTNNYEVQ